MIITKKINEIEVGNIYYCLLSKRPVLVLRVLEEAIDCENLQILAWNGDNFEVYWIFSNHSIDSGLLEG